MEGGRSQEENQETGSIGRPTEHTENTESILGANR